MIDLIKADLYKEFKKKSFKVLVLLIIFVSVFSLVVINKNIDVNRKDVEVYPLFSEIEYTKVNKYGSYKQYLNDYTDYVKDINIINELNSRNNVSNIEFLLNYSHNFLFILGVLIIIIAFHSFSYDLQNNTINYVFMSRLGRKKIFFSKLMSVLLISFLFFIILIVTMLITSTILTGENIFTINIWVNNNGYFKKIMYVIEFLKNSLVYIVPYFFMIVFSMFLSIIFKGSNLGLVISLFIYFMSLMFSQILFNFGFTFIEYTFLPYVDFTYLVDSEIVSFNNLIYNLDFSYNNSIFILIIYSIFFMDLSLWFLKRDV